MYKTFTVLLFILVISSTPAVSQQEGGDGCHVYMVDVALVKQMEDRMDECIKQPKKCGIQEFANFRPTRGEEELTTKTYKFPWAPLLTITASVFFTDETLATEESDMSAVLTITLAPKSPKKEQADENSAQAEFVLGSANSKSRVKRYYQVKGKQYLVGLECDFKKNR